MDRNNALTDPSKIVMKFENVYFINGTAYAGKSTMVKLLAEKYDGIACEENYQDRLLENLDAKEFPNLTYTRDLQDWGEFVRRTPDEYEAWVNGVTKECTVLELEILKNLVSRTKKRIFVDTNISVEILHKTYSFLHKGGKIRLLDNIRVENLKKWILCVRQKNKVDCSTFRLVFVKLVW